MSTVPGAIDFTDTAPFYDLTISTTSPAVNEGAPVTLDASFVDFDNVDTPRYTWQVSSTNGQQIAEGTGTSFTFTPDDAGCYTVTYTVYGQEGTGTTTTKITSEAVPPTLMAPSAAQNAGVTEGSVATVNLGTLTAAGIGPWKVTVEWGDGQSSTFTTTSTGLLTDTHDYTSPGEESIYVVVSEAYGDATSLSFSVGVLNAATTTAIGMPTSVTYGQSATVTATVSGAGTPTGTVLLYLGAVNPADQIGSGTLSVVGGEDQVTFSTPATLHVSGTPYTLIAVYDGDASHQASQQSTSLTITPYAFTYQIGNDSQVYGTAANLANDLGTTIPTGVNGQDLDIAYSSTGDTATAHVITGGYAITGTVSTGTGEAGDYSVTLKSGTLTVNSYAFTYQIGNDSQVYGTAANLANDLGTTIPTGVNGQNLDIAYSSTGDTATAHVITGGYAITGTVSTGTGEAGDYSVTLKSGTLTVNSYAFTYQIGNDSQVYGTAANLAKDLGTTITIGVNGQNLDIAYSSAGDTTTANVQTGGYAITGSLGSGTGQAGDYSVTLKSGTLTVNAYAFTYQIGNDSQVYGTAANLAKDLGTTISTGVNGQNLDIAYSSAGDTATADAGTYAITGTPSAGTGPLSDYSVTLKNGTLTVNPYAFTYQIGNDSQVYGTAANLAKDLGTAISTGVNSQNLAIAYTSSGDTATAPVATYPITGTLSGGTGKLSDYNVTLDPGTLSVTLPSSTSIYVLDPSAGGALNLSGSASVNIPGTLVVDSSSSSAIVATGSAKATATGGILVVGGVSLSGSAKVTKTGTPGGTGNPLADLPEPTASGTPASVNLGGNSSLTINPGVYSQINVSGSGKLTMAGGTYIIEGGGFSVSGAGSVTGSGVLIVNAGTAYPKAGGTYGGITLAGSGSYNLTPMSNGTYSGILFFQTPDNTKAMTVSGHSSGVTGMIDAPSAALTVSGSGQIGTGLIVDTMTVSGGAVANALTPPSGSVAYTPAQIRSAYGINSLSEDGTGQTIAIVDAYDDPGINQGVDDFDTQFGLTDSGPSLYDQYGPASSFLTVLNQDGQPTGLPTSDPTGPGAANWELEEAVDVEWAHAIAPGAGSSSSRRTASRSRI